MSLEHPIPGTSAEATAAPRTPSPTVSPNGHPRAATIAAVTASRVTTRPSAATRWLHRISALLFVMVCAIAGVLLVVLPWRPEWTDNHLLMASPALREFVSHGFFRGFCSGLGLLDIWIGFAEAIHYREVEIPH